MANLADLIVCIQLKSDCINQQLVPSIDLLANLFAISVIT